MVKAPDDLNDRQHGDDEAQVIKDHAPHKFLPDYPKKYGLKGNESQGEPGPGARGHLVSKETIFIISNMMVAMVPRPRPPLALRPITLDSIGHS
jgi:hypothetical protein